MYLELVERILEKPVRSLPSPPGLAIHVAPPRSSSAAATNGDSPTSQRCPACESAAVVAGTFDGRTIGAFHPDDLRFWTLGPVAAPIDRERAPDAPLVAGPFGAGAHACTACGLAWVHVEPGRLRAVLEASGKGGQR
jgi:hypothetical protein